ncbi:DUF2971 domain-containing protein [Brochothrix thermosphacta]|uniref:DUF2971 domain-containing protein n=1 Tax=Brochothrix thermosphacta TaxID=2756 RepID=UPI0039AF9BEF
MGALLLNFSSALKKHTQYVSENFIDIDESEYLYHYTSTENINNILNGEELWVTHIKGLNDMTEGVYVRTIVLEIINEFLETTSLPKKHYQGFIDVFNRGYDSAQPFSPYVLSLSKNKDSLNMWHSYTEIGSGVNIEFNYNEIIKDLMNFSIKEDELCIFGNCIYDKETQKEILRYPVQLFVDAVNNIWTNKDGHIYENQIEEALSFIQTFSVFIKNPSFVYEEEARIVFLGINEAKIKKHNKVSYNKPTNYIKIPFNSSSINSLLTSPSTSSSIKIDNKKYGDLKIGKSTIPMRY